MNPPSELPLALACSVTLCAAWLDAKTGRIPDLITLPALPAGLLLGALAGGLWGLGSALLGALLCFAVPCALFYASRGTAIGGADVKLFGALGALLGPSAGLKIELASLLVLAACALVTLAWRGQLLAALHGTARSVLNRALPEVNQRTACREQSELLMMRLGPAICVATWSLATLQYLLALLAF